MTQGATLMIIILVLLIIILLYSTLYFRKRYRQHWLLAYDYMYLYNSIKRKCNVNEPPSFDDAFRRYLIKYYGISSKSMMHREQELISDIQQHRSIFNEKSH